MAYNPKDFYFKKAKEKNFAARSVFKLEEINDRFKLFKHGQKVLDLGCAPGSWTQYACQAIGKSGLVIGIDLQKVLLSLPGAHFIQGDAFDSATIESSMKEHSINEFDLVMSDMAPKTTGIRVSDQQRSYELCLHAQEMARKFLRPGGSFIVKFFQSESFEHYIAAIKPLYTKIELLRPKSTRKSSYEIYIIGLRKK